MSTTTADYPERLNLAEQVARIERSQEETRKFVAEQHKLMAEQSKLLSEERKLSSEQIKLMAEAGNLRVSRFLTPTAAVVAAIAALTAAAPVLVRWLGGGG